MKGGKPAPAPRRGVCLCAEISFDGTLLEGEPPAAGPFPAWWTRLLARRRSVRVEAGVVRTLLEAGSVDELCLRVRPCVDGRAGQPTLGGVVGDAPFLTRSITWTLARMATTADGGCLLHYRRAGQ